MKKIVISKSKEALSLKSNQEKGDKLYVKWKNCDDSPNSWIDKKDVNKSSATKADLKNARGANTLKFSKKVDLASLNQKLIHWMMVN